jgi:hypothetical protein
VIIAIVVIDILGSRPDKRGDNPFALKVDEYKDVDPELILYDETKNLKLQDGEYRGIAISEKGIYILADNYLQLVDDSGREKIRIELPDSPRAISDNGERLFIGFQNYVGSYDRNGEIIKKFEPIKDSAVVTSMVFIGDYLYVADAGNRQVLRYSREGELLGSFKGKRESDDLHGFIIPSPYFDIVNNDEELWVVNPGMHTLENYSKDGDLRGYWEKISMTIEGFSGCCNPAHLAVLPNGYFVTSEKGIVRIKVYEQSGKLIGVVAAPAKFKEDGHAPDIAVSGDGVIYALDFDRQMIRVFEKKS